MKEITMRDLTPEIMKVLEELKTKEEMKDYCRKEGYDLTDELADRIVAQFEKSGELSDDEVEAAAGGKMPDWYDTHYTC